MSVFVSVRGHVQQPHVRTEDTRYVSPTESYLVAHTRDLRFHERKNGIAGTDETRYVSIVGGKLAGSVYLSVPHLYYRGGTIRVGLIRVGEIVPVKESARLGHPGARTPAVPGFPPQLCCNRQRLAGVGAY
eukprot:1186502-Prorocentrum_minimum.AAC.4